MCNCNRGIVAVTSEIAPTTTNHIRWKDSSFTGFKKRNHRRKRYKTQNIARLDEGWKKSTCFTPIFIAIAANTLTTIIHKIYYYTLNTFSPACLWNFKRLYIKSLSVRYVRVIHFASNGGKKTHNRNVHLFNINVYVDVDVCLFETLFTRTRLIFNSIGSKTLPSNKFVKLRKK